jgi:hypothetical protein
MSFITYIKENSDLLNDDDDKNPLFYLPVIIKVSAGKTTEELKDDYQLKSLLNFYPVYGSLNLLLLL